ASHRGANQPGSVSCWPSAGRRRASWLRSGGEESGTDLGSNPECRPCGASGAERDTTLFQKSPRSRALKTEPPSACDAGGGRMEGAVRAHAWTHAYANAITDLAQTQRLAARAHR